MATKGWLVQYEIDVDADTPREAAEAAEWLMRAPDAMRPVLDVTEHDGSDTIRVDLADPDDEGRVL